VNVDTVEGGFVGLVHDGNPGTWPIAPFGAFVWISTQRVFGNQAVIQEAYYGYQGSGSPSLQQKFTRIRSNSDGIWGDWQQDYNSYSLVGSVAQDAGRPTGAVIERGSNANGDYVRFADGSQICTLRALETINSAVAGSVHESVLPAWTFPATFVKNPTVFCNPHGSSVWGNAESGALNQTGARNVWSSSAFSNAPVQVSNTAIGYWF